MNIFQQSQIADTTHTLSELMMSCATEGISDGSSSLIMIAHTSVCRETPLTQTCEVFSNKVKAYTHTTQLKMKTEMCGVKGLLYISNWWPPIINMIYCASNTVEKGKHFSGIYNTNVRTTVMKQIMYRQSNNSCMQHFAILHTMLLMIANMADGLRSIQ